MKKFTALLASLMLLAMTASAATAAPFLQDYGFNVDGTTYYMGDSLPGSINTSAFDFGTGLGSVTLSYTGPAGSHYLGALFDHDSEIDLLNETGSINGSAPAGLSWEISKPYIYETDQDGFLSIVGPDAIYGNFAGNSLANASSPFGPNDVAMAMIRQFTLAADQTAYVTFFVNAGKPGGFSLQQTDLSLDETIYFSSAIRFEGGGGGGGTPVPEPSTFVLFGTAIAGLGLYMRKRRNS